MSWNLKCPNQQYPHLVGTARCAVRAASSGVTLHAKTFEIPFRPPNADSDAAARRLYQTKLGLP